MTSEFTDELRRKADANDALHAVGGKEMRRAANIIDLQADELREARRLLKRMRAVCELHPEQQLASDYDAFVIRTSRIEPEQEGT